MRGGEPAVRGGEPGLRGGEPCGRGSQYSVVCSQGKRRIGVDRNLRRQGERIDKNFARLREFGKILLSGRWAEEAFGPSGWG